MIRKIKMAAAIGALTVPLVFASDAWAGFETLVQFSTTGTGDGVTNGAAGGYNITGIQQFDWQSSGDLVIVDNLTGSGSTYTSGGVQVLTDSFATWAAN